MSAELGRRSSGSGNRGMSVPAVVPPQVVSDRSILDSAIGFINEVTLAHQPHSDPKDTITWARFETAADISDPRFGEDWEVEGNVAPPLLLILGYGLGVQVWAIPANGEAVEVLSWRHGIVSALRVLPTPICSVNFEDHGRVDEQIDHFSDKRPLIALVDGSSSAGAHPQFCAVNFVSLKTGQQLKTIKFKNPVLDVLANRSSIVITFHERIAVFDALTFEDRLSITTCYPSPGINPNPVALGPRWLAYAEHKLIHSKRSGGGCDGDGVPSYTATVLNAAKSFSKGLRELGEQVAAGLTGSSATGSISKNNSFDSNSGGDAKQPGIITILDIKNPIKDYSPTSGTPMSGHVGSDPIVAHFIAHSEAVVACEFDNSGMLLVTADRRGHDFHVFRIQPHPVGSSLAAVHHLYILHRGDTSAKVQNIAFSLDSRWVAISTLRGTTHVFPITPYGGSMGFRTHTSLHVVNKLSRFHRSAGLTADGRSSSPISHSESTTFVQSLHPYHNPTLPPYPKPTVVQPLAQLRQPFVLGSPPGTAGLTGKTGSLSSASSSQRQRLSSLSDDSGKPLSVCGIFAKSRSWLLDPPNATREAPHRIQRKAVDSLFVMAGHGALIQYDLDVKLASNIAKEKICDDTPIELDVEAKAQWNLVRRKEGSQEIIPPLSLDNWLIKNRSACSICDDANQQLDDCDDRSESWLSQVEIITHAGPHRRLWMGPQFVFKTYNAPSGSNLSHVDAEAVEIGVAKASGSSTTHQRHAERSSPLNMPLTSAGRSPVPVLIESGSYSSIEQSPKLMDRFRHDHLDSDFIHGDTRLKEDLADAMRESPSVSSNTNTTGARLSSVTLSNENIAFYDALTEHELEDCPCPSSQPISSAAAALASALPNIYSFDPNTKYESLDSIRRVKSSIEKIVNPLGTVTTVTAQMSSEINTDMLDEVVSQLSKEESVIHENCDESLFRPVVAIFCDENERRRGEEEARRQQELATPPEVVGSQLIVPVIAKEVNDVLNQKEKQKYKQKNLKYQKELQEEKANREFLLKQKQKESTSTSPSSVLGSGRSGNSSKTSSCGPSEEEDLKSVSSMELEKPNKQTANKISLSSNSSNSNTASVATSIKPLQKTKEMEDTVVAVQKGPEHSTTNIRTEQLNVSSLTDSLLELDGEERNKNSRESSPKPLENSENLDQKIPKTKAEEKGEKKLEESSKKPKLPARASKESSPDLVEKPSKLQKESTPPLENKKKPLKMVEVLEAPKPISRKNNKKTKKQNRSGSNSESEEIIEIPSVVKSPTIPERSSLKVEGKEEKIEPPQVPERKKPSSNPFLNKSEEKPPSPPESWEDTLEDCVSVDKEPHFPAPEPLKLTKASKKALKKAKRSGSSSESEEVIEVSTSKVSEELPELPPRNPKNTIKTRKTSEDLTETQEKFKKNAKSLEIFNSEKVSEKSEKPENVSENYFACREENKLKESCLELSAKKESLNESEKEVCKDSEKAISKNSETEIFKITIKETFPEPDNEKESFKDPLETCLDDSETQSFYSEKDSEKSESISAQQENVLNEKSSNLNESPLQISAEKSSKKECKSESNSEIEEIVEIRSKSQKKKGKNKNIQNLGAKSNKDLGGPKISESEVSKKEEKKSENPIEKDSQKPKPNSNESIYVSESSKSSGKVDSRRNIPDTIIVMEESIEISGSLPGEPENTSKDFSDKKSKKFSESADKSLESVPQSEGPEENIEIKDSSSEVNSPKMEKTSIKNKTGPTSSPKKTIDSKSPTKDEHFEYQVKVIEEAAPLSPKVITKQPKKSLSTFPPDEVKSSPAVKPESPKKKTDLKTSKDVTDSKPVVSAWKTMSGADMITKNLDLNTHKTSSESVSKDKLLPDLPTPGKSDTEFKESMGIGSSKSAISSEKSFLKSLDDFPTLRPLDPLPPLPTLEPLEDLCASSAKLTSTCLMEQSSLINFESPLQENPALGRKITPPPRGFSEQNLIMALCGSLHYEDETAAKVKEDFSELLKPATINLPKTQDDFSPKPTKNEKLISSSNSSASEDIIVVDDRKLTKKQKRKKQQQLDLLKQKSQVPSRKEKDDEELRPFIWGLGDSNYIDTMTASDHFGTRPETEESNLPSNLLMDESFIVQTPASRAATTNSTTTDSEGPMPATTSDDNICTFSFTTTATPNKIKTKKLEHKFNLIAAIEAATSSSTSSAEEETVDLPGGTGRSSDTDILPFTNVSASPLPVNLSMSHSVNLISGKSALTSASTHQQPSALKKKTKRRKR